METVGPLVELITSKGWGVIFVYLWWRESRRADQLQEKRDELLTRTLEAIQALRSLMTGRPNGGQ